MNDRTAFFASGRGTNFVNLVRRCQNGELEGYEPILLLCDKNSPALEEARKLGLPSYHLDPKSYAKKSDYEEDILRLLKKNRIDVLVLAGYLRLVGETLLDAYEGRILNIHPSLLPAHPGLHAIEKTYASEEAVGGVTVHYVDRGLDSGPILLQREVPLDRRTMDLADFEAAIHACEYELYPEALRLHRLRQLRQVEPPSSESTVDQL